MSRYRSCEGLPRGCGPFLLRRRGADAYDVGAPYDGLVRVLLVEPYYGGSHKAWADGYGAHSAYEVTLVSHPARFWKWRMQGGADADICARFGDLTRAAATGQLDHWAETPRGRLALLMERINEQEGYMAEAAALARSDGMAMARWFYRGFTPRPLEQGRRVALYGTVPLHALTSPLSKPSAKTRL